MTEAERELLIFLAREWINDQHLRRDDWQLTNVKQIVEDLEKEQSK